jgi:hypothetical protein
VAGSAWACYEAAMTFRFVRLLPLAILSALALPASAQETVVDLDTALRCSAAFRFVATQQESEAFSTKTDYPPMSQRGREFFVQTAARLMDEQKLDRDQLKGRFLNEIRKVTDEVVVSPDPRAALRMVMTPCLTLLDATVPPSR